MELKTKEAKENRRTSQAREQARWNRENKLQWCNHSRSQLLRALQRLKLLSDQGVDSTSDSDCEFVVPQSCSFSKKKSAHHVLAPNEPDVDIEHIVMQARGEKHQ